MGLLFCQHCCTAHIVPLPTLLPLLPPLSLPLLVAVLVLFPDLCTEVQCKCQHVEVPPQLCHLLKLLEGDVGISQLWRQLLRLQEVAVRPGIFKI